MLKIKPAPIPKPNDSPANKIRVINFANLFKLNLCFNSRNNNSAKSNQVVNKIFD